MCSRNSAGLLVQTSAPSWDRRSAISGAAMAATISVLRRSTIAFGDSFVEIIHLDGHTPGSIALLYRGSDHPHLFSADSLFPGGPGRTWSEPDFWSLVADLEARVFDVLPDDTWVYPGHGDDTTLGKERPSIPDWKARGWVDES